MSSLLPAVASRPSLGSQKHSNYADVGRQFKRSEQFLDTVLRISDVPAKLVASRFDWKSSKTNTALGNLSKPYPAHFATTSNDSSSPSSNKLKTPKPRKPSPGLAARLKALGIGQPRKSISPPAAPESVGRLPEDQIRKIDQDHLAGSQHAAIQRRGRPWKGATVRVSSNQSFGPAIQIGRPRRASDGDDVDQFEPLLLPKTAALMLLEMETHKYRLPDHSDGDGAKAQRETREEHIARDTRPPPSPEQTPPPSLLSDSSPLSQGIASVAPTGCDVSGPNAVSYFNPLRLQRAGSIYTLSRASFANQLAQLTSIQLFDAESLSSKAATIPTAQLATSALINGAEQIRGWIYNVSEVVEGLESDDDVEWAAAGGREGVEEVEQAMLRFEELIDVYVGAIEELQGRSDIESVSPEDLNRAVAQMEANVGAWTNIRSTLQSVKDQVEIAMEWEELWNHVLGDIQSEMEKLSRMVFEMEERRHKSILAAAGGDSVDIGDLETIVKQTPPATRILTSDRRLSLPTEPASLSSPAPGTPGLSQDDSSLLALFARMQPLKASLDFLPMRLSVFESRAEKCFPIACEELEMRRAGLAASFKKLEKDAESLRKELGEDRWVLVFRGACRQAHKVYDSVERSVAKLKEAIDAGMELTNHAVLSKRIQSFEGKKTHYGPAIERVLAIIDKGVRDRLTVNGEILRRYAEMQSKWAELKERIADLDLALDDLQADKKGQQLRDSVSSVLSNDRSTAGSGHETPGSSPPTSVIMASLGVRKATAAHGFKQRATSSCTRLPQPSGQRQSSLPTPTSRVARKPVSSRVSALSSHSEKGPMTPTESSSVPARPASKMDNRPRWNGSVNPSHVDTGHNFKPLSLTTPSPYAKKTASTMFSLTPSSTPQVPTSKSPLSCAATFSPEPALPAARPRLSSFRDRLAAASPGPYSSQTLSKLRLTTKPSMISLSDSKRTSLQPPGADEGPGEAVLRPASSPGLAGRASLLPMRSRTPSMSGAPQVGSAPRVSARKIVSSVHEKPKDNRPRWR